MSEESPGMGSSSGMARAVEAGFAGAAGVAGTPASGVAGVAGVAGFGYGYPVDGSGGARSSVAPPGSAPWPTFPLRAVWYAVAGILGGFVAATIVVTICSFAGLGQYSPVVVLADLVALWTFLLGAAILASRRYGTGDLGRDYRLGFEPMDVVRGFGGSLLGRFAVTVIAGVILAIAQRKVAGNTEVLKQQHGHLVHLIAVGAGAVIGAPVVEELFFRGLLLRSLAGRLRYGWAVVIQGCVFGLAHTQFGQDGWTILAVVAGTAGFGMVQGMLAARWRLGALMVSHGFYNLVPVLVVAFS